MPSTAKVYQCHYRVTGRVPVSWCRAEEVNQTTFTVLLCPNQHHSTAVVRRQITNISTLDDHSFPAVAAGEWNALSDFVTAMLNTYLFSQTFLHSQHMKQFGFCNEFLKCCVLLHQVRFSMCPSDRLTSAALHLQLGTLCLLLLSTVTLCLYLNLG